MPGIAREVIWLQQRLIKSVYLHRTSLLTREHVTCYHDLIVSQNHFIISKVQVILRGSFYITNPTLQLMMI